MAATEGAEPTVDDTIFKIHILQTPDEGLGIDIAGGRDSWPYKGNDRVSVSVLA